MVKLDSNTQFELDNILTQYWDATSTEDKKECELHCYMLFKKTGYNQDFLTYLETCGADDLATELHRFQELHDSVPHEHELRKAA